VSGLVIGLTALAVPGIGPVLAAGPLATALVGAGVGAAAGGMIGALTDLGIPEEHAHYYSEGVRRGGVLVTVATTDARAEQAVSILSRHNPIDLSRRSEEWRQGGWKHFDPHAEPYRVAGATPVAGTTSQQESRMARTAAAGAHTGSAAMAAGVSPRTDQNAAIPVVEEDIEVGKRAVERDVRVHTTVTERPVEQQVHLREERVTVERRPADRPASAADQAAFKEGTIEMTETVEEPVINKRARVVEEVVVHKEAKDRVETVRDTVRHTNVDVEHENAHQESGVRGFDAYDAGFRRHFNTAFAQQQGVTYDAYMPAYRYGYTLATDKRYSNRDWTVCESDARRDWERQHPGTWERFKDAIRHAWDEVRGRR
jgi:stress response protein YsnF